LEELFEKFGEITNIHINKDRDTGLPRGFGFVYFREAGPGA
jgi:RNA recognition motif-containing protein